VTGTVRWFEPRRGFGFIVPDDDTDDVFVHHGCIVAEGEASLPGEGALVETLEPGDEVEFDVVDVPYGRQARRVRRVEA
jgi:CspA family cold shock protein